MSMKLASLAAALLVAGCANTLTPAPLATEIPGPQEGALARASGVQMKAQAGAWEGTPRNLQQKLTPMWVEIVNDGNVPLRVRYNELMLVAPKGRVYKALPPFSIDGQVSQRVAALYPPTRFSYAPYYSPYFAGAPIWGGPFLNDPLYWNRYGSVLRQVELPTLDMLQRALPEGVIEPGGKVQGFVYFPGISDEVERVRLRADLINAQSGAQHVSLTIPFVVG